MHMLDVLKQFPTWVCWKIVGKDKIKLPINPHTGRAASTKNSKTWGTYQQALERYTNGNYSGLGFVFQESQNLVGIDLDKCVISTNPLTLTQPARQIVETLDSYTELSPSGTGVHILVWGQIPASLKLKQIEMYNTGRYFTMTGEPLLNKPIEDRSVEVVNLYTSYRPIQAYGDAALRDAIEKVSMATEGERNNVLFAQMAGIVELVNTGDVDEVEARTSLKQASMASGLSGREAQTTIDSAFKVVGHKARTDRLLSQVLPSLTEPQKEQVAQIVENVVGERSWLHFHQLMNKDRRIGLGLSEDAINAYKIGYRPQEYNNETGEIISSSAYTVPFSNETGQVVQVEYRMGSDCEYETSAVLPFFTQVHPTSDRVIVLPDSILSIQMSLTHHLDNWRVWGLPHDFNQVSLPECVDNIVCILGDDDDYLLYKEIKDRCRFLRLPMGLHEALPLLNTSDIRSMIRQATKWEYLCD